MASYPLRPVEVSAHIKAPPDEVFAFVADTRNDPLWCPNVETVVQVDGNGISVGARFRFHQHLDRPGGERLQFDVDLEILAIGDRSITWLANDKLQTREIGLTVQPEGDGTRITQVTKPIFRRRPGFVRWVYPRLARRAFAGQFELLADHFKG